MAVEQVTNPAWRITCDFCAAYVVGTSHQPDGWEYLRGDPKIERWEIHICQSCAGTVALNAIRQKQAQLYRDKADQYNAV